MGLFAQLERAEKPTRLGVVGTGSVHILKACERAKNEGLVELVLIGNKERTEEVMALANVDFAYSFHQAANPIEAADKSISLAKSKQIDLIMKGSVETGVILKAMFNKKNGIPVDGLVSAVSVFEYKGRFLLITDAAINISPGLEKKSQIIQNGIDVARCLGIAEPKVAVLTPTEVRQDKIQETVDGEVLSMRSKAGLFGDAIVEPMALDVALSKASAAQKRISNPVAGQADILFAQNLTSANILHKCFALLTDEDHGAVIAGTGVPLIITSRSENDTTKLNSILLAGFMASQRNKVKHAI